MDEGRLIRVSKYRGDPHAVSYLVAVADKAEAIALIARQAATSADEVEDLGRVSAPLITAMRLPAGQFMPIAGVGHVTQQQQQPQTTDKEKE